MTDKDKKPTKADYIRYILETPMEDILDKLDPNYRFVGDTEQDRMRSISRFTRLRGIMQKGSNVLSADDVNLLIRYIRECVVLKDDNAPEQ